MIPPPPIKSSLPPSPVAERPWGEILSAADYPTDCLVLDWETYFDSTYSLSKLTVPQYIHDERFEVLGLAYRYLDVTGFAVGEDAALDFLHHLRHHYGPDLEGLTVVGHNIGGFDAAILAWKYGIRPRFIVDTLDLARSWHSRSKHGLATLADWFGLPAKGRTEDFSGLSFRKRMQRARGRKKGPPTQVPRITLEQVEALKEYAIRDIDLTWAAFEKLLPKLPNPKQELAVMAHTRRLFLEPTLHFDRDLAEELQGTLEKSVKDAIPEGLTAEQLSGTISFDSLLNDALHEAGDSPIRYQKHGKKGLMYGLAKTDDTLRMLLSHRDPKIRGLINGRIAVKSAPLHIGRIDTMAKTAIAGLMPVPLRYAGGHTGRFSGSMDVNVQNLPPKLKPLLVAPSGQTLVQADLAAIEARVLAYLAGQDDLCEAFRVGADVYCGMATTLMGWKVRKPRPDDPPVLAAKYKAARQRGKVVILGCIAEGSPVLTDTGWKSIESVQLWDRLWDGEAFVSHEGVYYQGEKTCVNVNGVWMTPDHEVLTDEGWFQGQFLCTRPRPSGFVTVNSKLSPLNTGNAAGLSPSNVFALVAERLIRTETTLSPESLHDVMFVLKWRLLQAIPDTALCNPRIVSDFLPEFVRSLAAATQSRIADTGGEESESTALGFVIDDVFLNTWLNFRDGTTLPLKLTGETTTKDMYRATCDSLRDSRMCGTLKNTYEIIRVGPNRRYQVGMNIVGNCGYGMGPGRMMEYAEGQGVALTVAEAEAAITTYRTTYPSIPKLWYTLERAFRTAAQYRRPCSFERGLKFYSRPDCDVTIELPNGRCLRYHKVRIEEQETSVFNNLTMSWDRLWGGVLTENVVQAVSRDILVEAMMRLEALGICTALHCHDSLVIPAPIEDSQRVAAATIKELTREPAWATGLPLAAEAEICQHYK